MSFDDVEIEIFDVNTNEQKFDEQTSLMPLELLRDQGHISEMNYWSFVNMIKNLSEKYSLESNMVDVICSYLCLRYRPIVINTITKNTYSITVSVSEAITVYEEKTITTKNQTEVVYIERKAAKDSTIYVVGFYIDDLYKLQNQYVYLGSDIYAMAVIGSLDFYDQVNNCSLLSLLNVDKPKLLYTLLIKNFDSTNINKFFDIIRKYDKSKEALSSSNILNSVLQLSIETVKPYIYFPAINKSLSNNINSNKLLTYLTNFKSSDDVMLYDNIKNLVDEDLFLTNLKKQQKIYSENTKAKIDSYMFFSFKQFDKPLDQLNKEQLAIVEKLVKKSEKQNIIDAAANIALKDFSIAVQKKDIKYLQANIKKIQKIFTDDIIGSYCIHLVFYTNLLLKNAFKADYEMKTNYCDTINGYSYCKICGEILFEDHGEILDRMDGSYGQRDLTDLQVKIWEEVSFYSRFILVPNVGSSKIINTVANVIHERILFVEQNLFKNKLYTQQDINNKISIYIAIYTLATFAVFVTNNTNIKFNMSISNKNRQESNEAAEAAEVLAEDALLEQQEQINEAEEISIENRTNVEPLSVLGGFSNKSNKKDDSIMNHLQEYYGVLNSNKCSNYKGIEIVKDFKLVNDNDLNFDSFDLKNKELEDSNIDIIIYNGGKAKTKEVKKVKEVNKIKEIKGDILTKNVQANQKETLIIINTAFSILMRTKSYLIQKFNMTQDQIKTIFIKEAYDYVKKIIIPFQTTTEKIAEVKEFTSYLLDYVRSMNKTIKSLADIKSSNVPSFKSIPNVSFSNAKLMRDYFDRSYQMTMAYLYNFSMNPEILSDTKFNDVRTFEQILKLERFKKGRLKNNLPDYIHSKYPIWSYYCINGNHHKYIKFIDKEYGINYKCDTCHIVRYDTSNPNQNSNLVANLPKSLDGVISLRDVEIFFQFYKERCPKNGLHEFKNDKCIFCKYSLKPEKEDAFYNKYYIDYDIMVSKSTSYKAKESTYEKGKDKNVKYSYNYIEKLIALYKINFNVFINLGLTDYIIIKDLEQNKVNPSDKTDNFYNQITRVISYIVYINSILNKINEESIYAMPEIKSLISGSEKFTLVNLNEIILDNNTTKDYSMFLLDTLSKYLIDITNVNKKVGKYFVNYILLDNMLHSKYEIVETELAYKNEVIDYDYDETNGLEDVETEFFEDIDMEGDMFEDDDNRD